MEFTGMKWNGTVRTERNGMKRNDMEWNGMNGITWKAIE